MSDSYVWLNGDIIRRDESLVNIFSYSLHYGVGVFDSLRSHKTVDGRVALFRLGDHVRRLIDSMRIYNMPITYSQKQLEDAVVDVVRQNNLGDAYIRMIAFYASDNVTFSTPGDVSIAIAPMALKQYFNKDSLTCMVSSWRRIDSSILPPHGKTTGHYANSVLATMDAKAAGVDEAIMLDRNGYVAEGSAQNIFLYKKGVFVTPSAESDILMGITRDTVLTLIHDSNLPYEERLVHKEELYTADELFFTGTATGILPITKVDGRPIPLGDISIGIKELYRRITKGELEQYKYWLTYV